MKNLTVDVFEKLYVSSLKLGVNPSCRACDARLKYPLFPWVVGSKYQDSNEKILFVGKPHRGIPGVRLSSGMLDPRDQVEELKDYSWAYWSYTKGIISNVYGDDDPWDYVAFTNLIKCTNVIDDGSSGDKTTYAMAEKCIEVLGVIFNEIKLLKPRTVIFYTYSLYRQFLYDLPESINSNCNTIHSEDHRVKCGAKYLPWWERRIRTPWSEDMRFLVTGHPERMKRDHFIDLITNWIKVN